MPPLRVEEIREVCHSVAKELMAAENEPIPPFDTVDLAKLESSIRAPFQSFDGRDLYPEIWDKAAALFYLIAKNHAFENGNKRIAVVSLLYFLAKNNLAIKILPDELYSTAVVVAESKSGLSAGVIQLVSRLIKDHLVELDAWMNEIESSKK